MKIIQRGADNDAIFPCMMPRRKSGELWHHVDQISKLCVLLHLASTKGFMHLILAKNGDSEHFFWIKMDGLDINRSKKPTKNFLAP